MPAVSTETFAGQLRSLDSAELAAFVADLWAARGFETTVEGATVVAERADGQRRIQCGRGRSVDIGPIDILVAVPRRPSGIDDPDVRTIGPEDLRQMLLYAIDRETADRLFRAHCGRSLATRPPETSVIQLPRTPARRVLAVGLVTVLAVGIAIGASGGTALFSDANQPVPSASVPTVKLTPQPNAQDTAVGTDSSLPAAGGNLFRYPPGIGSSGVTDADALAAAHRSAIANTSWTLAITHDRSLDLVHPYREWAESRQRIVRADASHYEYQVTGAERAANGTIVTTTYSDYGDDEYNYRRLIGLHGDAFRRTQLPETPDSGMFAAISAAYVHRYLSSTENRVETIRAGPTTRQRVVATGTPTVMARTVANYTAVAVVGRRGVVYNLTVEYTLLERVPEPRENGIATPYAPAEDVPTEPRGTVRFEFELRELGNTTLEPPGWYDAARNATNATDVPPWPADPAV